MSSSFWRTAPSLFAPCISSILSVAEYGRVYRLLFFAVSGYTYLGDSGTDPRAILRYGTHPGCIFSRFGGGIPGISKIENFGLVIKYKKTVSRSVTCKLKLNISSTKAF